MIPLLALKTPVGASRERLEEICDRPDAQLRTEFRGCGTYRKEPPELTAILDRLVFDKTRRFMEAREFVQPFRELGRPAESFILSGVMEFVSGVAAEDAASKS